MTSPELIERATLVLNSRRVHDRLFGDVGAVLLSTAGRLYTGVSVDTPGWGLCAERSAMAAMITAGEYQVATLVAVWRDPQSGNLHVLPPCGLCREFLRNIDPANLDTEVLLSDARSLTLRKLLPEHAWPAPLRNFGEPT